MASATVVFLFAAAPALAAALGPQTEASVGGAPAGPALLPTGQFVMPLAAPGSTYTRLATGLRPDTNAHANGAVTTALSRDGKTLLVLTSGYNAGLYTANGKPLANAVHRSAEWAQRKARKTTDLRRWRPHGPR